MPSPLDPLIPTWDARERFGVEVQAPAALVYDTAARFDLWSVPLVRAIFRLRELLLRSPAPPGPPEAGGFLTTAPRMGWGILREEPGRLFIAGAHCEPWLAKVRFIPLTADRFLAFADPGRVKIAWTLETEQLDPTRSRLATETRAVATDQAARQRFVRYWRWARAGIIPIRWLLLPAIRREAEARFRAGVAVTGRLPGTGN